MGFWKGVTSLENISNCVMRSPTVVELSDPWACAETIPPTGYQFVIHVCSKQPALPVTLLLLAEP